MPVDNQSLDIAARHIGDRWTLRLVGALLDDDRTFGELAAEVDGIAPTILTARLRSSQRLGLVVAVPYQRRPVRMRYSLSAAGHRLAGAIGALEAWGADRDGRRPGRVHATCGTPVESRPWCPTCDRAVVGEVAGPLDGPGVDVGNGETGTVEDLIWC